MATSRRLSTLSLVGALALGLTATTSHADETAAKGKIAVCASCHSENGISPLENIPSLAHQPEPYLRRQLQFLRNGMRKNALMTPQAAALTDQDIATLSGYFSALPPPPDNTAPDDKPELSQAGESLAAAHRCASCHTDGYAGTELTPRLAGQREDYLGKALHDYKSGARSGTAIAAMAEAARGLSDDDIAALAHYLSRL
jgi:cytochrome c553